jgi:hypothetical protein
MPGRHNKFNRPDSKRWQAKPPKQADLKVVVFFDVDLDVFPVRLGRVGTCLVHFSKRPEDFNGGDSAADTGDEKDQRGECSEELRQKVNHKAEAD